MFNGREGGEGIGRKRKSDRVGRREGVEGRRERGREVRKGGGGKKRLRGRKGGMERKGWKESTG